METGIVIVIILLALFSSVRHFTRIYSSAKKGGANCGCGCSGCAGSPECRDRPDAAAECEGLDG